MDATQQTTLAPERAARWSARARATGRRSVLRARDGWENGPDASYRPPDLLRLATRPGWPVAGRLISDGLARLARAALSSRRWSVALRCAQLAVAAAPSRAAGWLALAAACRAAGPMGLRHHELRGVEPARAGDFATALDAARLAIRCDPASADGWLAEGEALEALGRLDEARTSYERATQVAPSNVDAWFRAARIEAAAAARRGSFTIEEFAAHRDRSRRALQLDPTRADVRYHAVRVAVRSGDWAAALDAAASDRVDVHADARRLFDAEPPPDTIDAAVRCLHDQPARASRSDLHLVAFWRLIDLGWIPEAFEVKDLLAHTLLDVPDPIRTPTAAVSSARALTTLDRTADARRLIDRARRRHVDRRSRAALARLDADLALTQGDPAPHRGWPGRALVGDAEQRFASMLAGRSVAVVGPTALADHADEIAGFDLVVRTKVVGDGDGPRTDISYFANAAAQLLSTRIAQALDTGAIRLAVVRPTIGPHLAPALAARPDVRLKPVEFVAHLEASPYAVVRIVHDLLGYEPAEIKVFNTEFYAGGLRYDTGYRGSDGSEPNEPIVGYGHDLRGDHRLMSRLLDVGLITADPEVAEILRLDTRTYLARVAGGRRRS